MLAIAAARLGWDPVFAVDVEERAVESTRRNAERNGVAVHAVQVDLREVPPPPASTLAANLPFFVHEHVARGLDPATASRDRERHRRRPGDGDARPLRGGRPERAGARSANGWAALWLARA